MGADFGDKTPVFGYDKDGNPIQSDRPSTVLDRMIGEYAKNQTKGDKRE